jgi:hypothetical protein
MACVMARICASVNEPRSDEPRCPLVPKLTRCSGSPRSGRWRKYSRSRRAGFVDELDDQFGEPIGWRGLSGEEERPRRHFEAGLIAQPIVQHNDAQGVQQLALVFVDALDLAVEHVGRVGDLAGRRPEPVREVPLGLVRGFAKRVAEGLVVGKRRQLAQTAEIGHPAVADGLGDDAGEGRVSPATAICAA